MTGLKYRRLRGLNLTELKFRRLNLTGLRGLIWNRLGGLYIVQYFKDTRTSNRYVHYGNNHSLLPLNTSRLGGAAPNCLLAIT